MKGGVFVSRRGCRARRPLVGIPEVWSAGCEDA